VSGTDVWVLPSPIGSKGWGGSDATEDKALLTATLSRKGSGKESLSSSQISPATRAEALLRRLKHDPDMIRLDPSKDDAIAADFNAFQKDLVEKSGGVDGEEMVMKISQELKAGPAGDLHLDAKALIDNRDLLGESQLLSLSKFSPKS
jgi:hypothetical protein